MTYEELMQRQNADGLMDGQQPAFGGLSIQPNGGLMRFLHDQFAIPEDFTSISQQTPEQLGMNNMQQFSQQMEGMHPMDKAAMATSAVPIAGDAIGLMADARTLWNEPEQRTPMNFGLSALGALPFVPSLGMVKAWHGSPHKVDKFSLDKIGTGEGAQAYGHGLYFADNPDVAKTYQPRSFDAEEVMMERYKTAERAQDYETMEIWEQAMQHETPDEILKTYSDPDYPDTMRQKAQSVAKEMAELPTEGGLYNVNLDVEPEDLLDWDAPLSEQPGAVKKWVLQQTERKSIDPIKDMTGEDVYHLLQDNGVSDQEVSRQLNKSGIPGIQYLDGMSRDAAQGTRNYVIFDDELISINDTGLMNDISTAFDETTTDMPYYDDLIKSLDHDGKRDYFRTQKGLDYDMSDMTPDEYLSAVDSGFKHGVMSGIDQSKVDRYAEKMLGGEKFPVLTLDYSGGGLSQEGRHRSLAAKKAGINSVPVLTVKRNEYY